VSLLNNKFEKPYNKTGHLLFRQLIGKNLDTNENYKIHDSKINVSVLAVSINKKEMIG
jgi:hypothetical protein